MRLSRVAAPCMSASIWFSTGSGETLSKMPAFFMEVWTWFDTFHRSFMISRDSSDFELAKKGSRSAKRNRNVGYQ